MADRGRFHRDENPQSIPVSELLAAHKRVRRVEPEPEPQVFVGELLQRQQPAPMRASEPVVVFPTNRSRHLPILLGVTAAAAVLAGALVATNAMNKPSDSDTATIQAASVAPEHITGAKVFRPDVIRASLNNGGTAAANPQNQPGAGQAPAAEQPAVQAPAGEVQQRPGGVAEGVVPAVPVAPAKPPAVAPTTTRANAGTTTTQRPAATTTTRSGGGGLLDPILEPLDPVTGPILGPILGFYSTAPSQPTAAYQYLAPSLQDGTSDDFARSWDGISGAIVQEAALSGDDAMVVKVALVRVDGSRLLTEQRIVVRSGSIVDAQLLSVALR